MNKIQGKNYYAIPNENGWLLYDNSGKLIDAYVIREGEEAVKQALVWYDKKDKLQGDKLNEHLFS